jgi:hypothetical protein
MGVWGLLRKLREASRRVPFARLRGGAGGSRRPVLVDALGVLFELHDKLAEVGLLGLCAAAHGLTLRAAER